MFCRRRGSSGGNAQDSGWRDGPRRLDGDARLKTSQPRTDGRAAPATLRLHPTYQSRVTRRTDTPLQTR
jgi:hypothetical protein